MQLWKPSRWRSFYCVSLQRSPVLPPHRGTFSQGCSSALLFRDNDKALNPSVDLTFVPRPLFLNCLVRWRSCDLAAAGRIRCMFGQRWLQEPPSVWFGISATTTQLPAKPCLIYQIPKIIMWCLLWRGDKRKERRKKGRFTFVWGGLWGFEVWSLRHISDVLSDVTEMFTFDFPFSAVISRLSIELRHISKQYLC